MTYSKIVPSGRNPCGDGVVSKVATLKAVVDIVYVFPDGGIRELRRYLRLESPSSDTAAQ